jgi:hypothetical protein
MCIKSNGSLAKRNMYIGKDLIDDEMRNTRPRSRDESRDAKRN